MKDGLFIDWNGTKSWYERNGLHRIDGAAVEFKGGSKYWAINGKQIPTDEVNEWMKNNNISYPFDNNAKLLFKLTFG